MSPRLRDCRHRDELHGSKPIRQRVVPTLAASPRGRRLLRTPYRSAVEFGHGPLRTPRANRRLYRLTFTPPGVSGEGRVPTYRPARVPSDRTGDGILCLG